MPGFFDLNDPQSSLPFLGLLSGLGQAAMPSQYPVGIGAALGMAAQGYLGGKQNALEYQQKQNQLAMQNMQMNQQLGQINYFRQIEGIPPLTLKDLQQLGQPSSSSTGTGTGALASLFGTSPNQTSSFFGQQGGTPSIAPQNPIAPSMPNVPAPPMNESAAQSYVKNAFPGAVITSGLRTPEHNQAVGGIPNSMHLTGQALDFVLPKGMSFEDVKTKIAEAGIPTTELLNEGDHIHWGWRPKGSDVANQAPAAPTQTAQIPFANPHGGMNMQQIAALGENDPQLATQLMMKQKRLLSPDEARSMGFGPGAIVTQSLDGSLDVAHQSDVKSKEAQQQSIELAGQEAKAKLDAVPGLNPEAIDFFAHQYNLTGKIPPMYRDQVSRALIMNRAADIAQLGGQTAADVVAGQAGTHANIASLSKVTQYRNMVESFAQTANANANMALQLSDKGLAKSGVPAFNAWIQAGRTNIQGDPNVSAFNAALITFKNEYAKIMSGQTGGQGTSDAARHEADNLINKAMTPDQLRSTIATMQREMENRRQSLLNQEAEIRGSLSGRSVHQPTAGGTSQNRVIRYDQNGNRIP